ncbi:hypothetical protein [Lysobacter gummosus]|uniref:hypothetical protein n=1 Tax=Lysobacter gummosus TaxID=262324 RepID=UPI00363A224E
MQCGKKRDWAKPRRRRLQRVFPGIGGNAARRPSPQPSPASGRGSYKHEQKIEDLSMRRKREVSLLPFTAEGGRQAG